MSAIHSIRPNTVTFQQNNKNQQPVAATGITEKAQNTVAFVRKGAINVKGFAGGIVKGVASGAAVTSGAMGLGWAVNTISEHGTKKVFDGIGSGLLNAGKALKNTFGKALFESPLLTLKKIALSPIKGVQALTKVESVGKLGKSISLGLGLVTLGLTLWRTKLNINEQTAQIDHRFEVGHRK